MSYKVALFVLVSVLSGFVTAQPPPEGALRPWTVRDSIAVQYYDDVETNDVFHAKGNVSFSPDRGYFAFISHRGDLTSDSNRYELRIFASDIVERWLSSHDRRARPKPLVVIQHTSTSSETPGISQLMWDTASTGLSYRAMDADGKGQIFRVSLPEGAETQLTHRKGGLHHDAYWESNGRTVLVIDPGPIQRVAPTYPAEAPVILGAPMGATALRLFEPPKVDTFVVVEGGPERTLSAAPSRLWIAPDGSTILLDADDGLSLLDVHSMNSRRVAVRPKKGFTANWSSNSNCIGLSEAPLLAQRRVLGRSSGQILNSPAAASACPPTSWPTESPAGRTDFDAKVSETANDPPRVIVSKGTRSSALTEIDPLLNGIWLATQKPFRWTDGDVVRTGGLYLPRNYKRGHRVPLVIQAYRYSPDRFLPDGEDSTAGAAQLLAANGFAVLQYSIPVADALSAVPATSSTTSELTASVQRLDSAVAALSAAGIVDDRRVSITGFSHAGFNVLQILTHPGRTRLAAAIVADSFLGSYSSYLATGVKGGLALKNWERDGKSYWLDRGWWVKNETTFNVDRVNTPALFTMNGAGFLQVDDTAELEMLGAFRLNRRPFEYVFFPDGQHNLVRPRERQAMLELTLDWISFWTFDVENLAPSKEPQYARWRRMRADWTRQQAWEAAGHSAGSLPAPNFHLSETSKPD